MIIASKVECHVHRDCVMVSRLSIENKGSGAPLANVMHHFPHAEYPRAYYMKYCIMLAIVLQGILQKLLTSRGHVMYN